jgi:hypothetical protein
MESLFPQVNMDNFKPLNVHFEIEDKEVADQLRQLADALGDKKGDRRLRGAAVAKELVYAAVKQGVASELLGLASNPDESKSSSTRGTRKTKT